MSLPPLPSHPERLTQRWSEEETKVLQAYGQACREAALEDAALICSGEKWMDSGKKSIDYIRAFNEGCADCEAAIRRLK